MIVNFEKIYSICSYINNVVSTTPQNFNVAGMSLVESRPLDEELSENAPLKSPPLNRTCVEESVTSGILKTENVIKIVLFLISNFNRHPTLKKIFSILTMYFN